MEGSVENLEDEEEGIVEPQITSLDPNERKLARQLRIKKRLLSAKKKLHAEKLAEEHEEVDDRTLLEKQLDTSEDQLEKLLLEGKELVTNIRVANDAREVKRREDEVAAKERRLKRLEDETEANMDKYEEVNSKWEVILGSNDPLELHHAIEKQKEKCAELIAQKDLLIAELKKELKLADERFDKDQKKQKEDLWLLAERIDSQVKVMKRAYKQELKLIEDVMELERAQLMEVNNKKWEALYKERSQLEVTHMELKFEAVEQHEDEIYQVAVDHQENFRELKIKLETDIQILQQELEQVKAQCLMNSEKLVYNFQVLKKREEENLIVRAQQKRRINKLQDMVNSLRKKIAETKKSMQTESAKMTEEVVKLHHAIVDIENKADHFAEVNDKKYQQVWELNRETAEKLLKKILDIDQLLHEQQMGIEWLPPDKQLLKQEDLKSYRAAINVVAELFSKDNCDTEKKVNIKKSPTTKEDVEEWYMEEKFLRQILKLVAENSDFLVEQRLKDLLEPYAENEKTLIRIDNVFTALGVKTEADMLMMKKYFLPYAKCTMCNKNCAVQNETHASHSSHESISSSSTTADTTTADAGLPVLLIQESLMETEKASKEQLEESVCSKTHPVEIEPAYVLRALRDFAAKFAPRQQGHSTTLSAKRSTVSRLISTQDMSTYWARFREVFSPQREKLWDGLVLGLQRYHRILEDRHTLNIETEQLRHQNADLRRLLHVYIQDKESSGFFSSRELLPPLPRKSLMRKKYRYRM